MRPVFYKIVDAYDIISCKIISKMVFMVVLIMRMVSIDLQCRFSNSVR